MKKVYNAPCTEIVRISGMDIMSSFDPNVLDANDFTSGDVVEFGQIANP